MKVVWLHNFSPQVRNAGSWMFSQAEAVIRFGVEVDICNTGNLRGAAGTWQAKKVCRSVARQADVVHVQFGSALAYITRDLKCPKLLTLRGTDWYGTSSGSFQYRIHGLMQRRFTRAAIPYFDQIVVMSNRMAAELAAFAPNNKISIIPTGVDLSKFAPMDRIEARRVLGDEDLFSPWVVFPSLNPTNHIKRPWLAKAAVDCVRQRIPEVRLKVVAGMSQEDVRLYLNAAHVVLLTSTHEGWPNVIKEALACDVPFVATDVSDLGSIAEKEPSCFVAPPDPDALAERILKVLALNERPALRHHVGSMTVEESARRLIRCYEEILEIREMS
jgi:glycosyltransferase involved in cell wall biosynthesis